MPYFTPGSVNAEDIIASTGLSCKPWTKRLALLVPRSRHGGKHCNRHDDRSTQETLTDATSGGTYFAELPVTDSGVNSNEIFVNNQVSISDQTKTKTNYERRSGALVDLNVNSSLDSAKESTFESGSIRSLSPLSCLQHPTVFQFHADDECYHCAAKGLDLVSRESRIQNYMVNGFKHGFSASPLGSCEFQFSFTFFLAQQPDLVDPMTDLRLFLSPSSVILPEGTRLRIKINDHLRGEEGIRGWLIILEANNVDHLFKAIDLLDECRPSWSIWTSGTFSIT